ncbi:MAG: glutamate--tRNA ligase [archaeon]
MTNETTTSPIPKELVRAHALENAINHDGKPNQNAILSALFSEGLEKSQIKNIIPIIQEVIQELNNLPLKEQKEIFKKLEYKISKREIRVGLKKLPNAEEKKVVMRLAPFPSGPLHIGNARTAILNDEYAKMYNGKFIIVMDDTIGSEEKPIQPEAYELIKEGLEWLDVKFEKKIIYKSNRTKQYYKYAEEMLKKGYLYVCHCDQDQMHKLKIKGIACPCRELTPDEQIKRWKQMFKAKEGTATVRLKTNMQDPDPAFRDRVMFKISDRPHPRTKTKFRIYPSMEFSWAIDDHVLGVTHVLRGMEHHMSTRVQNFIRKIFDWPNPESIYNGHFAIKGIKISKSKGAQEVKSKVYQGWNDPRTWSLQSLRDRGITKQAIRQFILGLGMRQTNITVPIETLYALNRKILNNAQRYFFVEQPEKITINGCPHLTAKIPLHPDGKHGTREYQTTQNFLIPKTDFDIMQNGNYRLMHLLNFKSENILKTKPRTFSFISTEQRTANNEQRIKYLQWLPADAENIKIEITMPDGSKTKGLGEQKLTELKEKTIIQFERFGFVRLHEKQKNKLEFWFAHN